MQVVFRPEAENELLEAQAWYEKISPGLGYEFARAVDVSIAKITRTPKAFSSYRRRISAYHHSQISILDHLFPNRIDARCRILLPSSTKTKFLVTQH